MKEISGINHIGLRVTELEQARAFYERPLNSSFTYILALCSIRPLIPIGLIHCQRRFQ